ncbi:MAG: hypothetical protein FJY07_09660 [Bacteroidetes bacterium]|nr:hypothetical protein [Bacteroidota bacterium]
MGGFIAGFRRGAGKYILNKKLAHFKREKKLINLHSATTIGIVYTVPGQEVFNTVKKLVKDLTSRQRQVMALGFVNRKSIPNYCIAAGSGYHFSLSDLNWYGAPRNAYIAEFINTEFDVLIDLNLESTYVLNYITSLSKAKFKVGRHDEGLQPSLDMMIKMDAGASTEAFIEQIIHYLVIIKPNAAAGN